jgi:hypothetical protein
MKKSVNAGVVLGVVVAVWVLFMGFSGLYKNPLGALAFLLVIPINIGVVVWGLRRTRAENGYGGQILAGLVIGVVGSVIIMLNSYVFTTMLFPNYFDDIRQMQEEFMTQAGLPQEEIDRRLEEAAASATPGRQAITGGIGTVGTSLVTAVIAGIWLRRKD